MEKKYYINCLQELLNNSSKFLELNQNLILKVLNRKGMTCPVDSSKKLFLSENSLIALTELCEPLEDAEVDQLLERA